MMIMRFANDYSAGPPTQYINIDESEYIPDEWKSWEVYVPSRALIANSMYNQYLNHAKELNYLFPEEYASHKVKQFLNREGEAE